MFRTAAAFAAPLAVLLVCVALGWAAGAVFYWGMAGGVLGLLSAYALAARYTRNIEVVRRAVLHPDQQRAPHERLIGSSSSVGALYRDVTRFVQRSQLSARASSVQLQQQALLLDRMHDGLMRVSHDGIVTYGNVAASALFGGRNPVNRSFIGVTRDHELNAALMTCFRTGAEQRQLFEIPGEGRIVEGVIVLLNENPAEALVMLRDITEINMLLNLRRDFVANVSHELRTPLSTIKILTETLLDIRDDDEEAARFLNKIDAEIDSMTALVRDLLDLTRLESAAGKLAVRNVDAGALVRDVCDRMRPLALRHNVAISERVDEGVGSVSIDERRMHQALINLITNAIAHTEAGGSVTVSASAEGGRVAFEVADNGSGIPAEDLPRVWERFFKSDRARTGPGTGLGLAIVKHIAQAHNGSVSADSQLGVGSTFRVLIPRGATPPKRPEPVTDGIYVPS